MAFENGVNWQPIAPDSRGRHKTFGSALEAAFADLMTEHHPFFDTLPDVWPRLFADLPMLRPGRYEAGRFFVYVRSAPALFASRSRLSEVKRRLATLPGAPKRIELRLEIHP